MRVYEGTGRGGPLDGSEIKHDRSIYRVNVPVLPEQPPMAWFDPEALLRPQPFNMETHSYVHVLGQWVWQRDAK